MKAKPQNTKTVSQSQSRPQKVPRKITPDYLRNAGLYYLGRYNATTYKFRTVMMNKITKSIKHHENPTLTDAQEWLDIVINDFLRLGYLNDQNYSQSFIKGMKDKGFSSRKISQKLNEKGISNFLPSNDSIDDLLQLLKHIKRKRLGAFSNKPINHEKLLANLARQGFGYNECQKALSMSAEEINDYLYEMDV